jgi:hypothetical protein
MDNSLKEQVRGKKNHILLDPLCKSKLMRKINTTDAEKEFGTTILRIWSVSLL